MITSGQNPKIKDLLALETQSHERKARGLFVVEGRREFERACAAGFEPVTVFVREGEPDADAADFLVSDRIYEKIAYRGGTEGLVAVLRCRETRLEDLQLSAAPLILVLEHVEKPGAGQPRPPPAELLRGLRAQVVNEVLDSQPAILADEPRHFLNILPRRDLVAVVLHRAGVILDSVRGGAMSIARENVTPNCSVKVSPPMGSIKRSEG